MRSAASVRSARVAVRTQVSPNASVEQPWLRQPEPGQLLFKVVKVQYLIDMLQKNYLHFQRVVRAAAPTRRLRLRGQPGIGVQPCTAADTATRFGRGGLAGVVSSEVHVQLRLLIGDVCAGHGEDLFLAVENLATPTRRHGVAGRLPPGNRADAGIGLRPGYARPAADPRVIHPD